MIIGIDESGSFDFKQKEKSIFVAIIIPTDKNSYQKLQFKFEKWERNLDDKYRDKNGEVKGILLNEIALTDFINKVMIPEKDLRILYVCFDSDLMNEIVINKHRDIEIAQFDFNVKNFEENNAPRKQTNYMSGIKNWMKSKNSTQYMKILGLRHIITYSLRYSAMYYISNYRESEIINGSYLIDKDFISDDNVSWKGYFKRLLKEHTKVSPIPIIEEWDKENHPFYKRFPIIGQGLDLSYLFNDNLKFTDSKTKFELRIADITAIIIYRYLNQKKYNNLYKILENKRPILDFFGESLVLRDFDYDKKLKEFIDRIP